SIMSKATAVPLSDAARHYLDLLVRTGFYGRTIEEAAERIVLAELRRMIQAGELKTLLARSL
ncbi:MAG TPA: hypothetical protein VFP37_11590, partial [Steroidobacteraceae bacterium]|nr:hypothetical protein [Steroidobacteraceae bacterium]